ncbi:MAG TPA: 16S rRNA (cytidine(1402)-2'-O)-methyltransferase [Crocinitomix sp.]|nr:16S rRNA (cytidine(1402)-2'-O)-methyltransferase [Crocinitomix sp.]
MGKLYIVPTPIGNLEDITLRAIRVLKEVDAILAEDTRVTSKLLKHFDIDNKLISHHQHNEHKTTQRIVDEILNGMTYAVVSDAGTPAISDPGFFITRACIDANIEVDCLPGATAFVPAIVNSGFPCEKFQYIGFMPHKKGRQTIAKQIAEESKTTILYESPHRILKTLNLFLNFMGENRRVSVSREISKKFEETLRGTIPELISHFENKPPKGEFVMVIEGKSK